MMTILQNQKYKEWVESKTVKGWLTFFTPTFNRAQFLPRLYDMLASQTNRHFVWILVCDGSSDNTKEVVDEMLKRDDFPILFIYKPNGGKHSAFKVGLENTFSEYFICMDDDDIYHSNSVETFLKEWSRIEKEGKVKEIGAIRTLVRKTDGSLASNIPVVEGERMDCTTLERDYIQHVQQENWTCYRTDALKSIDLFPDDYWLKEQHKFFLESIWQGRFARKYKCRYYNVILRDYTDDADISLIRAVKSKNHYMNMFINYKMLLDEQLDYIKKSPRTLLSYLAIVSILRQKLRIPMSDLLKNTETIFLKTAYIALIPIPYLSRNPKIKD